MNKNQSVGIWIVVGLLAVALISMLFVGPVTTTENMTYSDFLSKVRNGQFTILLKIKYTAKAD